MAGNINTNNDYVNQSEVKNKNFRSRFLFVIGLFYFGQGYSLASLALFLPLYIKDELNASSYSQSVGISAIIISPWYFKVFFGILSDNFPIKNGRRKPYLVLATFFSIIGWVTLGLHSRASILFILSGFILAIGSAMGDAVIDGQVVEITPKKFIGRLQGVAWGSRGLGIGTTSIISSQIVQNQGWQMMFYVSGLFGVSISIIVLVLPQYDLDLIPRNDSKLVQIINSFKTILFRKNSKFYLIFFLLSGMSLALVTLLPIILDKEFNYEIEIIGYAAFTYAVGSFFGAIINGVIFDRGETIFKVRLLIISYTITIISSLLLFIDIITIQFIIFFIIGSFAGAFEAYQLKIIQEASLRSFESTAFATYTGISNLGQFALGGFLITYIAELLSISILISLQLTVIMLVLSIYPLKKIKFTN